MQNCLTSPKNQQKIKRYEIEASNHRYLNTNPTSVESWSADNARSHLTLSDSEESSSSDYSLSSSQSSSSSLYSPLAAILPNVTASSPIRSPTQSRRQPLYATTRHRLPSPVLRRDSSSLSSSSATSSYPPPTFPLNNNNNNDDDQLDNNSDMIDTIQRNRDDPSTRFSTPTRKRRINSLRVLKGFFVGYSYSRYLQPCYRVVARYANGTYGRVRITKDVIFDLTINFKSDLEKDLPTIGEFNNIPSLELVHDEDNADALRRQLIMSPAIQEVTTDNPSNVHTPDVETPTLQPEISSDPYLPSDATEYKYQVRCRRQHPILV